MSIHVRNMMTKVIRITSAPENLSTCTEFLKKKKKKTFCGIYISCVERLSKQAQEVPK